MQLPFYIGIAAPGMIGLLAGSDIALGYEIYYLLPGRLIDFPHKVLKGRCGELMIPSDAPAHGHPASSIGSPVSGSTGQSIPGTARKAWSISITPTSTIPA